jgi:hypothetical protein
MSVTHHRQNPLECICKICSLKISSKSMYLICYNPALEKYILWIELCKVLLWRQWWSYSSIFILWNLKVIWIVLMDLILEFKSWSGDQLFLLSIFLVILCLIRQMPEQYLKLGCDKFLLLSYKFSIHCHWILCHVSYQWYCWIKHNL